MLSTSIEHSKATDIESQYVTVFDSVLTPSTPNLEKIFDFYTVAAKQIKEACESDLAVLYGNFKQAKFGNNMTTEPWFYEFIAIEKWRAWTACKNKPAEFAMYDYCVKVDQLLVLQNGVEKTREILMALQ